MLARDAAASCKSHISNETFNFDEINSKLKKIISFCLRNLFNFVIKCGFALGIAFFI